MRDILPEYNIEVVVKERKKTGKKVISASSVRKAYMDDDWDSVADMCPESTVKILKDMKSKHGVING